MPLKKGIPVSTAIRELHGGDTYERTKAKFGKERADKQAIAIAIHNAHRRAEGGRVDYPKIGLAENPAGVPFHCPSCRYFADGYCEHKDPQLHGRKVTARHCCDLFRHDGMKIVVK